MTDQARDLAAAERECRSFTERNGWIAGKRLLADYDRRGELLKGRDLEQHMLRNAVELIAALERAELDHVSRAGYMAEDIIRLQGELDRLREQAEHDRAVIEAAVRLVEERYYHPAEGSEAEASNQAHYEDLENAVLARAVVDEKG